MFQILPNASPCNNKCSGLFPRDWSIFTAGGAGSVSKVGGIEKILRVKVALGRIQKNIEKPRVGIEKLFC